MKLRMSCTAPRVVQFAMVRLIVMDAVVRQFPERAPIERPAILIRMGRRRAEIKRAPYRHLGIPAVISVRSHGYTCAVPPCRAECWRRPSPVSCACGPTSAHSPPAHGPISLAPASPIPRTILGHHRKIFARRLRPWHPLRPGISVNDVLPVKTADPAPQTRLAC